MLLYLYTASIKSLVDSDNTLLFEEGIIKLSEIDYECAQRFKFEGFYLAVVNFWDEFYLKLREEIQLQTLEFLERAKSYSEDLTDVVKLDDAFPDTTNAFIGIDFSSTQVPPERQITSLASFSAFSSLCRVSLNQQNFRNLYNKRYSRILFCENALKQMENTSDNELFQLYCEVFDILQNLAIDKKQAGRQISLKDIPLNSSFDTKNTCDQYRDERTFKCPDDQTRLFSFHIKKGANRIYLDIIDDTFVIAYVGVHLRTSRYN